MNFKNIDKKLLTIIILSLLATFNAGYLTYMAYVITAPVVFGGGIGEVVNVGYVCDLNSTFSCSSVFKEDFAWIFGIPFSLIALLVYPIIVIVGILGVLKKIKNYYKIILAMAIGGVLFNGYIIANEYMISTYCILCLICTGIIIINGGLSIKGIKEQNKNNTL